MIIARGKAMVSARVWVLTAACGLLAAVPAHGEAPVLTREANMFKLDGEPIAPFGLRAANALQSGEITDRLIGALEDIRSHGMQSIAVTIQGGRYTEGGNSAFNGFQADGALDPDVAGRLERLLDAMAEQYMVPVVMLFYRGRDQELEDANAVRAAVENSIEFLAPWPHAWVHLINEPNHPGFDHEILTTPEGQAELYDIAKAADPNRIVNVSHEPGANDGFYVETWGRLPEVTPPANGDVMIEYTRGESYDDPGVYDEGDRPYEEVDDYRAKAIEDAEAAYRRGGYWFWHAAWHQKADEPGWPRFDKGGAGTASDPGAAFIWDRMREMAAGAGAPMLGLATGPDVRLQSEHRLDAIRFTAEQPFTARAMQAVLHRCSSAGALRMAIYADADGRPGEALSATAEFETIPGVNPAVLAEPVEIAAGETYWLAAWHDSTIEWEANEGEGVRMRARADDVGPYQAEGPFPDGAHLVEESAVTYAIFATPFPTAAAPAIPTDYAQPAPALAAVGEPPAEIGQWERFEAAVENDRDYADPYRDVTLEVTYTRPDGSEIAFWGFHDGDSVWRLRCLPDQVGEWRYEARFSDGAPGLEGTFECVPSDTPGLIGRHEANPMWFGFQGGGDVLIRGFHVGDRFFASNWSHEDRVRFLDWAESRGYNLLSIASHYLNRDVSGRGHCWNTPDLWPLDAAEYRRMEGVLDELAGRGIMVFPFGGFFGRNAAFPQDPNDQTLYVRYTLARLGGYWNVLLNVGGPEPLLSGSPYFTFEEVNELGEMIQEWNRFGHLLSVHNATGDDPFKDEPWLTYGTLQGPKTASLDTLSDGLLRNHPPETPLLAQETLWSANQFHINALDGRDYTDTELRKNAWVIHMSAAALVFGDMGGGNSSAGFTGSMDPDEADEARHAIVRQVWDLAEQFPFHRMTPRQDLVDNGFCLAEPGERYLIYLPSGGGVDAEIDGGPYRVEWFNPQDPSDRRDGGETEDGRLTSPEDGDDWLAFLVKAE